MADTFFWLLENDGHNDPTFHKFANQAAAEDYIDAPEGYFGDDDGEFEDTEGTRWSYYSEPKLYISDHTKK
jgi:uncharacterized glyoxalase superfamily protein PhnB